MWFIGVIAQLLGASRDRPAKLLQGTNVTSSVHSLVRGMRTAPNPALSQHNTCQSASQPVKVKLANRPEPTAGPPLIA